MLGLKARLGITTGVALLAAGFAVLPASQALASNRSCQQEANGYLLTCAYVSGSGLHINYFQGQLNNDRAGDQTQVHLQLTGPHLNQNCGTTTVASLDTIYCTWRPNANEAAGNYCATSWQYASHKWNERGHAGVDVYS